MAVIEISPGSPDTQTPVTITFQWYGCHRDSGFERVGNTFNRYFDRNGFCTSPAPGGYGDINVGLLEAGTYTVIYERRVNGVPEGTSTLNFAVVGAQGGAVVVPSTDFLGSGILVISLLVVGALAFRCRVTG